MPQPDPDINALACREEKREHDRISPVRRLAPEPRTQRAEAVNLRALKSLVAIVEHGSFQEAARRLALTQSAISMQIKALEEELGVALLDRRERPLKLTECGDTAVHEARLMLAAEARIHAAARGHATLSGTLFLGVIPTASTGLLPHALKGLRKAHPALGIRVESGLSGELIQRLRQGALDAAMVTEPDDIDPSLDRHLLLDEPLVLIDSRETDGPLDLASLTHRPFIRFNRRAGVGQLIDRLLGALDLEVETIMELDSVDAISRMVSEGLGVAIVPALEHPRPSATAAAAFGHRPPGRSPARCPAAGPGHDEAPAHRAGSWRRFAQQIN